MAGANGRSTVLRVTLPVLSPAILGATMLVFVKIMESFEVELFLGYSRGIYVYTTRIYDLVAHFPTDFPQAMALTTVFLAMVFGIIALQWRLLKGRQFVTITGRGFGVRPTRLGRWRWVTFSVVLLYFLLGTLLPVTILGIGTFMKLFGIFVEEPFTTQNWARVFADSQFWGTLRNTLVVGIGAASLGMILYSLISYVVVKSSFSGRRALDFISWLPWGVPGLVMALGFLWAYVGGVKLPFVIYGTIYLLILVFIVKGLPLGVRVMNGAMVQIGNELEESSRVLGASWSHTFRRIIAPLLTPSFISAWLLLFFLSVRDVVTPVLLYTPKSRVLSIAMLEHWLGGQPEVAMVIGLITTVVLLAFALVARWVGAKQEVSA
ncbi:MAG: iron ABC transporter permease [Chloroflexi bacterium]|nr:iron ABC transporter permease [Chloroflexota bacterium]